MKQKKKKSSYSLATRILALAMTVLVASGILVYGVVFINASNFSKFMFVSFYFASSSITKTTP